MTLTLGYPPGSDDGVPGRVLMCPDHRGVEADIDEHAVGASALFTGASAARLHLSLPVAHLRDFSSVQERDPQDRLERLS